MVVAAWCRVMRPAPPRRWRSCWSILSVCSVRTTWTSCPLENNLARWQAEIGDLAGAIPGTEALLADRLRRLEALRTRLESLSPMKVLERGYAIVMTEDGRAVRAASEVEAGQALGVRLAEGGLDVTVRGRR